MGKKETSKEQASKMLEQGAKTVGKDELNEVVAKVDQIEERFKQHGPLRRLFRDMKVMTSMVKSYVNGEYRKVPGWTIAAVVAALLYVLNPFDLIPDFIPGLGYVDDALVVGVCLRAVEQDLKRFVKWKNKNSQLGR